MSDAQSIVPVSGRRASWQSTRATRDSDALIVQERINRDGFAYVSSETYESTAV